MRASTQSATERSATERGFTLVEVVVTSVVLVPILFAILSTRDVVTRTISTNDRRADTSNHVRRVSRRVRQIARPGLLSSVKTRALQLDIDLAIAAESQRQIKDPTGEPVFMPALGDWISPYEFGSRNSLQFMSADGNLALNSGAVTAPRSLEFELDPNEFDNGIDDDKDGIVDEGKLYFRYDGSSYVLLANVEACTFSFQDGVLVLFLQAARRENTGKRMHRASVRQRIYFRNN